MVRVGVTGGAGFIGLGLARLLSGTHELVAIDNLSTGSAEDAFDNGYKELREVDVRDALGLRDSLSSVDAVVHLAAQTGVPASVADPRNDMEVNVVGTVNLLEAARDIGIGSVVLASSAAPLGASAPPASETVVPRPLSPYGASKLAVEAYAFAYAGSFNLSTYTLRFSNVYGPWSYGKGSVVALWMRQLMQGQRLQINGDGSQTRDFVHVDDICAAVGRALECTGPPGLYQLGTGVETSILDLAHTMAELFGISFDELVQFAPPLPGEVPRSYCDISLATSKLEWEPKRDMAEGLAETKAWFEENRSYWTNAPTS